MASPSRTASRKVDNSRRSVSLLDVSAVGNTTKYGSQQRSGASSETLASGCKDSGYVWSEDEEPRGPTDLIEELKFKNVLISELQESNRGWRLRCATAENKVWQLKVKCEAHCACCQSELSKTDDSELPPKRRSLDDKLPARSSSYGILPLSEDLHRSSSTGALAREGPLEPWTSLCKVERWQRELNKRNLPESGQTTRSRSGRSSRLVSSLSVDVGASTEAASSEFRDEMTASGRVPIRASLLRRTSSCHGLSDPRSPGDGSWPGGTWQLEAVPEALASPFEVSPHRSSTPNETDKPNFGAEMSSDSDASNHQRAPCRTKKPSSSRDFQFEHVPHRLNRESWPPPHHTTAVNDSGYVQSPDDTEEFQPSTPHLHRNPRQSNPTAVQSPATSGLNISIHNSRVTINNCACTSSCDGRSLTVPSCQGFDPKTKWKRRIERGMKQIASDGRAEIDSLSFKPWPPPDMSEMSPLMRCLAETSGYARQMAAVADRARRLSNRPDPLDTSSF